MDDRPAVVAVAVAVAVAATPPRWRVLRLCQSSRHQRQLLAQAYQQVFPQVRQSPGSVNSAAGPCGGGLPTSNRIAAARIAAAGA